MKIVKLNRNYKINKNHGFEIGIKFPRYTPGAAGAMTVVAHRLFGHEAFMWEYYPNEPAKGDWATAFGTRDSAEGATPYWIYLRKESMLSMLMLALEHEHE